MNDQERMARAGVIAAKRLQRIPVAQVMDELGISRATYYRALDQARQHQLFDQARDFILQDLLPRALRVYALALEKDDIDVARHILEATVLGRNVAINHTVTQDAGESFAEWRVRITNPSGDPRRLAPAGPGLDPAVLPIDLTPSAPTDLPPDRPGGPSDSRLPDRPPTLTLPEEEPSDDPVKPVE